MSDRTFKRVMAIATIIAAAIVLFVFSKTARAEVARNSDQETLALYYSAEELKTDTEEDKVMDKLAGDFSRLRCPAADGYLSNTVRVVLAAAFKGVAHDPEWLKELSSRVNEKSWGTKVAITKPQTMELIPRPNFHITVKKECGDERSYFVTPRGIWCQATK